MWPGLAEPVAQLDGRPLGPGETAASRRGHPFLWTFIIAVLLLGAGAGFYVLRARPATEQALAAREIFHMPRDIDGFAVIALLRRLRASRQIALEETQQRELQCDLQRVEQSCFGAGTDTMSETDLRNIATKWLAFAS